MLFSRTVHLLLDVEETDSTIRFRDACHKSFEVYDGSWTITPQEAGTELTTRRLNALIRPSVPSDPFRSRPPLPRMAGYFPAGGRLSARMTTARTLGPGGAPGAGGHVLERDVLADAAGGRV
jgi:hypothetical protein